MISIKHLKGKSSKVVKYLNAERERDRTTDYYRDRDAPARWVGAGAAELGLAGEVDNSVLAQMLEGHLPNGADLTGRGNKSVRRMGTDLTISAPKSVSIIALANGDERILKAWDESVAVAAKVIEREIITARLGHAGAELQHTNKMVAAAFRHEDARTVGGKADPDLHTHLVVLNTTQRQDGTWSGMNLDFGRQNKLMHLADFAAKAHLAQRLQEMGYAVYRTQHGFEIEGITRENIEATSRRKG